MVHLRAVPRTGLHHDSAEDQVDPAGTRCEADNRWPPGQVAADRRRRARPGPRRLGRRRRVPAPSRCDRVGCRPALGGRRGGRTRRRATGQQAAYAVADIRHRATACPGCRCPYHRLADGPHRPGRRRGAVRAARASTARCHAPDPRASRAMPPVAERHGQGSRRRRHRAHATTRRRRKRTGQPSLRAGPRLARVRLRGSPGRGHPARSTARFWGSAGRPCPQAGPGYQPRPRIVPQPCLRRRHLLRSARLVEPAETRSASSRPRHLCARPVAGDHPASSAPLPPRPKNSAALAQANSHPTASLEPSPVGQGSHASRGPATAHGPHPAARPVRTAAAASRPRSRPTGGFHVIRCPFLAGVPSASVAPVVIFPRGGGIDGATSEVPLARV